MKNGWKCPQTFLSFVVEKPKSVDGRRRGKKHSMKQNLNCQTDRSQSRFFYTPASNTRHPPHHVVTGVRRVTAKFLSDNTWVRIPSGGPRNNGTSAIG